MSMNATAEREGAAVSSAQTSPAVRFEAVSLGGPGDARQLHNLSFALAPGSFHVLTGAAGCGKTSVLNLICLASRPAAGRVQLFGRDAATLNPNEVCLLRRRIGLVFARDRLLEHLSVFDNAALVPRIVGAKRSDYAPRVAQVLAWMGLGKKMDAMPGDLSAGERRRLAIARAVGGSPEILLADEPTGGLDGDEGQQVLRLLAELNSVGTTVLMASRDEELAAASGAPVLQLREGRLTVIAGSDRATAP
jgi:cell division transport system ATP-binding protein